MKLSAIIKNGHRIIHCRFEMARITKLRNSSDSSTIYGTQHGLIAFSLVCQFLLLVKTSPWLLREMCFRGMLCLWSLLWLSMTDQIGSYADTSCCQHDRICSQNLISCWQNLQLYKSLSSKRTLVCCLFLMMLMTDEYTSS